MTDEININAAPYPVHWRDGITTTRTACGIGGARVRNITVEQAAVTCGACKRTFRFRFKLAWVAAALVMAGCSADPWLNAPLPPTVEIVGEPWYLQPQYPRNLWYPEGEATAARIERHEILGDAHWRVYVY